MAVAAAAAAAQQQQRQPAPLPGAGRRLQLDRHVGAVAVHAAEHAGVRALAHHAAAGRQAGASD